MITCNRCGKVSPAGAVNCQTCGAPLSSESESSPSRMAAPQEQPGLPAWLESLRAGERPAAPVNNASTFSTADLIEDGALPSWMRSGRQEANDVKASSPRPALRSAATPGPNTDDSRGINAKSLIDEQALPAWMHEGKQGTGPIPQGGIPASSLVQPDSAPEWMRSLQGAPAANPALPVTPPRPPMPSGQAMPPTQYGQPGRPSEDIARGFSAGELIDQQALPSWMRDSGQSGSSLPAPQVATPSAPNQAPWSPMPPQTPPIQSSPQQPMGMNNAPEAANNLSASSFIDPNALPSWLKSDGLDQSGAPQQQSSNAYSVPPRVENVRVPSRPRGEINPNEGNEAAANVFASMLGVASSIPSVPSVSYGMPQGGQMPGQGTGGLQNPQQGYAPAGLGSGVYQTGNLGSQGSYQTGNLGSQGSYQTGNPGPQGSYQTGNPGQQANLYSMGGAPPMQNGMPGSAMGGMGADPRFAEKPAKKGIFETIRDWFR
jgi:hypothetical protein